MDIKQAIADVIALRELSDADMRTVMRAIMTGKTTPSQIAGFIVALRMKGETAAEIAAAASIMREFAQPVPISGENLVDTCGTGGDGAAIFNVSTVAALIASAAGARVAKHGNRSVSSSSGSADLLEAAGVKIDLNPEQVAICIKQIGIGFMFAPQHHGAMVHAIGPRKELGIRTIFNLLGPLSNPAGAAHQVVGVFDGKWMLPMAKALRSLGTKRALVVHGEDGLDEISISGPTRIAELRDGEIKSYRIGPSQFGISTASLKTITVSNTQQSLEIIQTVLAGKCGPARDIACLNAAAALYATGACTDLLTGFRKAEAAVLDGSARGKLESLVKLSNSFHIGERVS